MFRDRSFEEEVLDLVADEEARRHPRPLPPALRVPCPTCGAGVGAPCRPTRGALVVDTYRAPHAGRGA